MRKQEEAIYREIQRNAGQAITAIETMWDKVYDKELSRQLSGQSLKYAGLKNQAGQALLEGRGEQYRESALEDLKLKAMLGYQTLLNTSTGHVVEVMLKERDDNMQTFKQVLKCNDNAGEKAKALAGEFLEFQQKSVTALRDYL